jgi:hypothetical protein
VFKFQLFLVRLLETKSLACPICQSNRAEIAGEDIKLSGIFKDKEYLKTKNF